MDGIDLEAIGSQVAVSVVNGYDLAGRAVVLVAGNGQTSSNTYDALGRLQDRTLFKTSAMTEADVQAEFSWQHDALGNVLAQHETWPGELTRQGGIRSTVMAYDANNRLLEPVINFEKRCTKGKFQAIRLEWSPQLTSQDPFTPAMSPTRSGSFASRIWS